MVLRDIPKLIDEPTIGLDAASKLAVRGFIPVSYTHLTLPTIA